MIRWLARLCALLLALVGGLAWAAADDAAAGLVPIPPLTARVTDLTGTLDAGRQAALEQQLAAFEARKGAQVVVLLLPGTQPESIEQFGTRLLEAWKVGRQGIDDGALLIVAKDERRLRIEVGYGLEGALNDATAKRIIEESIVPLFKAGDFPGGIQAGVDAMLKVIDGEALPAPAADGWADRFEHSGGFMDLGGLSDGAVFAILAALVLGGTLLRYLLGNLLGCTVVGSVTGGVGWLVIGGWSGIAIGAAAGIFLALFGLDLVLSGIFGGGGGRSSGGGGGGFSGGGGSGGGGGASGSW